MTNVPPTENFVRFGHAGFDRHTGIRTDRQTDKHTGMLITMLCSPPAGDVKMQANRNIVVNFVRFGHASFVSHFT